MYIIGIRLRSRISGGQGSPSTSTGWESFKTLVACLVQLGVLFVLFLFLQSGRFGGNLPGSCNCSTGTLVFLLGCHGTKSDLAGPSLPLIAWLAWSESEVAKFCLSKVMFGARAACYRATLPPGTVQVAKFSPECAIKRQGCPQFTDRKSQKDLQSPR